MAGIQLLGGLKKLSRESFRIASTLKVSSTTDCPLTSVVNASTPLDKATIATSNGLISAIVAKGTLSQFNSANKLKLGPAPMTEKLREQVARTIHDEENQPSPTKSALGLPNGNGHANGDGDGDVEMGDETAKESTPKVTPTVDIKIEPGLDPDLVSPAEGETNPPVPAVFRIADVKREVEAVRDRRKMIRLGAQSLDLHDGGSAPVILPSVLAVTVFDGSEG